MKALNLYILTRTREIGDFSKLAQALSGRTWHKAFSTHEAASLRALVDALAQCFMQSSLMPVAGSFFEEDDAGEKAPGAGKRQKVPGGGKRGIAPGPADFENSPAGADWLSFFDGFYFSYTIEHISKEFDLLKISGDGGCVLNIELKSESIEEERIRRQLEQNRYYLSHIARTILSYTYVMETGTLYCLNDHGYLKKSPVSELAQAMKRPALQQYAERDIGRFFRAQDYLISPVASPEKFLTGRYFLTNQQADFRRQILDVLEAVPPRQSGGKKRQGDSECAYESVCAEKRPEPEKNTSKGTPVISLTGNAGTGKTLLLLDLAMELSKKRRVLFLHGGPLLEGHRMIDRRLHKVTIRSGTEPGFLTEPDPGAPLCLLEVSDYDYLLVDEANRFCGDALRVLLQQVTALDIPCIFSFDPHSILGSVPSMENAQAVIGQHETMRLELSGNIRINRPIYSFLRALFHQKDRGGHADYSCIDVLYAGSREEARILTARYLSEGYETIDASPESFRSGRIISQEFDKVLMLLDRRFYYDTSLHLCADDGKGASIPPLYEGLSRAREKLCLIVVENRTLFSQILAIRTETSVTSRA